MMITHLLCCVFLLHLCFILTLSLLESWLLLLIKNLRLSLETLPIIKRVDLNRSLFLPRVAIELSGALNLGAFNVLKSESGVRVWREATAFAALEASSSICSVRDSVANF